MVLEFRKKLLAEKQAANQVACEPDNVGQAAAERRKAKKARKEAQKVLKKRVEVECKKEFPQIVGTCRVHRWAKAAAREHWADLPEAFTSRASATTNVWRSKVGCDLKGRKEGGNVPLSLQRELDVLIMEMTSGQSDTSERKEVVSTEQVVAWRQFPIFYPNVSHFDLSAIHDC